MMLYKMGWKPIALRYLKLDRLQIGDRLKTDPFLFILEVFVMDMMEHHSPKVLMGEMPKTEEEYFRRASKFLHFVAKKHLENKVTVYKVTNALVRSPYIRDDMPPDRAFVLAATFCRQVAEVYQKDDAEAMMCSFEWDLQEKLKSDREGLIERFKMTQLKMEIRHERKN